MPGGSVIDNDTVVIDLRHRPASTSRSMIRPIIFVLAVAAVGTTFNWLVVAGVAALMGMILLHELGHFLAARATGMMPTEFFFGFGPEVIAWQSATTRYGIKAIPLGGYVKVPGMHRDDNAHEPTLEARTFRAATLPRKLIMAAAGPGIQLVVALMAFVGAFGLAGLERADQWSIATVATDSAASRAGMRTGDRIIALDGKSASYFELATWVRSHPGRIASFTIRHRDGTTSVAPVALDSSCGGDIGRLGITADIPRDGMAFGPAISKALGEMRRDLVATAGAIPAALSPTGVIRLGDNVVKAMHEPAGSATSCAAAPVIEEGSRPISAVGITSLLGRSMHRGAADFLFLFAIVNIGVALFNLLPFPPLDGGHMAIAVYERVRSRSGRRHHANPRPIQWTAVAVITFAMLLQLGAVMLDILHPL